MIRVTAIAALLLACDGAALVSDAGSEPRSDAELGDASISRDGGEPPPEPNEMVRVATADELLAALEAAAPGTVIFVDPSATIDLTGRTEIVIGERVTLASAGGVGGEGGALLFTDELDTLPLFFAREGARFTGLRLRGPDPDIGTEPYGRPLSRGITALRANNVQVDHSELSAWSHAAIVLDYARRAYVHHNSIHHTQRTGLGYGVVLVHASDVVIERNSFDYNRHAIAGTGRRDISYEAAHNLVGTHRNGHAFDMHGEDEADDNGAPWAGDVIDIHHNTFLGTTQSIVIRGRPMTGAFIDDNCFAQNASSAVLQRYFTGNLFLGSNSYGESAGRCHVPASPGRGVRSDVNGDGFADLVTLHRGTAYAFLGAGSGLFGPVSASFRGTMKSALFDGDGHLAVDVADVNADGRSDLVTAHSDGVVYVHPGTLLGGFDASIESLAGMYPRGAGGFEPIAVADVDGDGHGDLVSHRAGSVFVHPGRDDATFGTAVESFAGTYRSAHATGSGHFWVDVADVTGDGRADFVTILDGTAYVYPGQSTLAFGSSTASFEGTAALAFVGGAGFEPVGCADVTGDRRADLVMAHTNGTVYVYPGGAGGELGSRTESFHETLPTSTFGGDGGGDGFEVIAPLDVTGDGRADLVAASASGIVYVYRGNADGSFSDASESFGGAFESARFGGDGHEALAEKSVLRRRGCAPGGCF